MIASETFETSFEQSGMTSHIGLRHLQLRLRFRASIQCRIHGPLLRMSHQDVAARSKIDERQQSTSGKNGNVKADETFLIKGIRDRAHSMCDLILETL